MKCPKCGYATFPYVDNCGKCGRSLPDAKALYGVYAVCPNPPDLMLADEFVQMETADMAPEGTAASPTIDLSQLNEIELEVTTAGEPPLDTSADREEPQVAAEDGLALNLDQRARAADLDIAQPFDLDLEDGDATFTLRPVEEDIPFREEARGEDSGPSLEITDALELEVLEIEELDVEGDADAGPTDEDEGDDDR